ncbi:MAG: hypothetical protein EZS28_052381, partial [Streblomastix strix]
MSQEIPHERGNVENQDVHTSSWDDSPDSEEDIPQRLKNKTRRDGSSNQKKQEISIQSSHELDQDFSFDGMNHEDVEKEKGLIMQERQRKKIEQLHLNESEEEKPRNKIRGINLLLQQMDNAAQDDKNDTVAEGIKYIFSPWKAPLLSQDDEVSGLDEKVNENTQNINIPKSLVPLEESALMRSDPFVIPEEASYEDVENSPVGLQ